MIATLKGELLLRYTDRVIVDVGGVGYEVYLSVDGLTRAGELNTETFLFIHTHVREDAMMLYGFVEEEEKEMFLTLKSVSGIGPKLALAILSGMRVAELAKAIVAGDVKLLTSLPGVGKRTAERLCVELKEKVGYLTSTPVEGGEPFLDTVSPVSSVQADVLSALANLGYPDPVARQALVEVKKRLGDDKYAQMSLEEMLKEGLRALA